MLIIPPPKFRKNRKPPEQLAVTPVPPPPPGVPLVLQVAIYEQYILVLQLTFDREVDVTGLVGSAIQVSDGRYNSSLYEVSGTVEVTGPGEISCPLVRIGTAGGGEALLNVAAGNGIVAVDDGGLWPAMMGVVLPYSAP
jgi:hypothetical protein